MKIFEKQALNLMYDQLLDAFYSELESSIIN